MTVPYIRRLFHPQVRSTVSYVSCLGISSLRSRLPKNCRTNSPLGYLLLKLVQPPPHTHKMLHLGLVVLQEQPHVDVVVHPLGLIRERLHHVRSPSQALPYLLRSPQSPVVLVWKTKDFRGGAGLGFEPRLTDPLESVSIPLWLFAVVQKSTSLSQIPGAGVSRRSPMFTPVTVISLSKVQECSRFTEQALLSRNQRAAISRALRLVSP